RLFQWLHVLTGMLSQLAPLLGFSQHRLQNRKVYVDSAGKETSLPPGSFELLKMPGSELVEFLLSKESRKAGERGSNSEYCLWSPIRAVPFHVLLDERVKAWTLAGLGRIQAVLNNLRFLPVFFLLRHGP